MEGTVLVSSKPLKGIVSSIIDLGNGIEVLTS
jgi:hypothetical protein